MEKSFKTAKEFCEQGKKEKLVNYLSFFPDRTRQKLSAMVDQTGRSLIRYALASRSMDIVAYLAQEGILGDDFNRLLSNCAIQGDIEAIQIFYQYQPDYFTESLISDLLLEVSDPEVAQLLTVASSRNSHIPDDQMHFSDDSTTQISNKFQRKLYQISDPDSNVRNGANVSEISYPQPTQVSSPNSFQRNKYTKYTELTQPTNDHIAPVPVPIPPHHPPQPLYSQPLYSQPPPHTHPYPPPPSHVHESNPYIGSKYSSYRPTAPEPLSYTPHTEAVIHHDHEREPSGYTSSDSAPTGKYAQNRHSRSNPPEIFDAHDHTSEISYQQPNQMPSPTSTQRNKYTKHAEITQTTNGHTTSTPIPPQHNPQPPLPLSSQSQSQSQSQLAELSDGNGKYSRHISNTQPKESTTVTSNNLVNAAVPSGKYAKKLDQDSAVSNSAVSDVRSRIKAFEQKSKGSKDEIKTSDKPPLVTLKSRTASPNINFISPTTCESEDDLSQTLSKTILPIERKHPGRKSKTNQISPRKGGSPQSESKSTYQSIPPYNFYADSSDHTDDNKVEKLPKKRSKTQMNSIKSGSSDEKSETNRVNLNKIQLVTKELEKMFSDSSQGHEKSSSSNKRHPKILKEVEVIPPSKGVIESKLTVAEKKLTSIYFKMKSLGIPFPSIVQKMTLDGLPVELQEKIILEMSSGPHSGVGGGGVGGNGIGGGVGGGVGTGGGGGGIGTREGGEGGIDLQLIDSKDSTNEQNNKSPEIADDLRRSMTMLTKTKLQKLHWKPLNITHLTASSLWSKSTTLLNNLITEPDEIEIKNLEKLFGIQTISTTSATATTAMTSSSSLSSSSFSHHNTKSKGIKSSQPHSQTHHLPHVLDIQRATNISIGLVNFKDIGTIRFILNSICSLNDINGKLTSDKLLNFSNMLPTIDELKLLQTLQHTNNKAEIFGKITIEYYPYLPSRLQSFLTIKQFQDIYEKIIPRIEIFIQTIERILSSQNLVIIMNKMLMIGNILNAGTNIGHAKGFSLSSLAKVITMKATGTVVENQDKESKESKDKESKESRENKEGKEKAKKTSMFTSQVTKKITLIEYTIQSLKEKGFHSILDLVDELKTIDEISKINLTSLYHEIHEFIQEYDFLTEQLQISNDYLLFYYQGALESWQASKSTVKKYHIRENDLVNTPYGPGTVIELKSNQILKIRPLKWHLIDEVCHNFFIQSSQCSVRSPFEINEMVITHHGPGIILELHSTDNIAVIKPLTWMKSSFNLPLIYEPIVSLKPYYDPTYPGNESDIPKLTRLYTQHLQQFLTRNKNKYDNIVKLQQELKLKVKEFLLYFSELESSENHINELIEILKSFRTALIPLHLEEQNKKRKEQLAIQKYENEMKKKEKINEMKVMGRVQQHGGGGGGGESEEKGVENTLDRRQKQQEDEGKKISTLYSLKNKTSTSGTNTNTPPRQQQGQGQAQGQGQGKKEKDRERKGGEQNHQKQPQPQAQKKYQVKGQKIPTIPKKPTETTRRYVSVLSSSDSSDSSESETETDSSSSSSPSSSEEMDSLDQWLEQYSIDQKMKTSPQKISQPVSSQASPLTNNSILNDMPPLRSPEMVSNTNNENSHLTYLNHIQNYIHYLNDNLTQLTQSVTHHTPMVSSSSPSSYLQSHSQPFSSSTLSTDEELLRIKQEIGDKYKGFSFSGDIDELLHRREVFGKDSLTSIEMEAIDYYLAHYNELMAMRSPRYPMNHSSVDDNSSYQNDSYLTQRRVSQDEGLFQSSISPPYYHSNHSNYSNYSNYSTYSSQHQAPASLETSLLREKFSGFSFVDNIEDLLRRREIEGIEFLTSIELEALEYYDQIKQQNEILETTNQIQQQQQQQQQQRHLQDSPFSSYSYQTSSPTIQMMTRSHLQENVVVDDSEVEEIVSPIAAIRAAQELMKRTMSLLNDDENDNHDERKRSAEEIMERLERERIEKANEIMKRIESEMESQGMRIVEGSDDQGGGETVDVEILERVQESIEREEDTSKQMTEIMLMRQQDDHDDFPDDHDENDPFDLIPSSSQIEGEVVSDEAS